MSGQETICVGYSKNQAAHTASEHIMVMRKFEWCVKEPGLNYASTWELVKVFRCGNERGQVDMLQQEV